MSSSCNVHRHRISEIVSVFLTPSTCTTRLLTTMRSSSVKCLWRQLHLIHTENSPPNHCPANVRSGAYLCPGRNYVFLSGRFTARRSKCMNCCLTVFPLNWASAAILWTRLELREWQEINTLSLWRTDFNPVPPTVYTGLCVCRSSSYPQMSPEYSVATSLVFGVDNPRRNARKITPPTSGITVISHVWSEEECTFL